MTKSNIEWCTDTWNPLRATSLIDGSTGWHCEHVSPGCENCYAETLNRTQRWNRGTGLAYEPTNRKRVTIEIDTKTLHQPLHWKKPRSIFVCSMTDLFGDWVSDADIDQVFAVAEMAPQHRFMMLTKRAQRMREYILSRDRDPSHIDEAVCELCMAHGGRLCGFGNEDCDAELTTWPLANVWLGVSAEDQQRAEERIPLLRETLAQRRFVSAEPLLGPVDFRGITSGEDWSETVCLDGRAGDGIDWVIFGGESGPGARKCDVQWIRDGVGLCREFGASPFVKQLGSNAYRDGARLKTKSGHGSDIAEFPSDLRIREVCEA